ncbi:hypothetical protein ACFW6V_23820 [Streptomyces sp. NPDC058734]
MSQDTADAVDPTTDADEEALDRALAAGRSAAAPAPGDRWAGGPGPVRVR